MCMNLLLKTNSLMKTFNYQFHLMIIRCYFRYNTKVDCYNFVTKCNSRKKNERPSMGFESVGNPSNTVGNLVVFNIFRKLEIFIFIQNNRFSSSFTNFK